MTRSEPLYRSIVVDPPWDHSDGTGVNFKDGQITGLPYEVMSVEEITSLPVGRLASRQSHLYLWTTSRFLKDSFAVIDAWGFSQTATLAWCKPSRGWMVGGTFASNLEFVQFATRNLGDVARVELGEWLKARRGDAGLSAKQVCEMIGAHGEVNHGGALSNWELGLQAPTMAQWWKLKAVLGFSDEMDEEAVRINDEKGATVALESSDTRWFTWPRSEHSAKPEAFMDMVERISPAPRLEMFARRNRLGWDTWGNEVLEHVEVVA